jgi:ABC-type lipoprotein release transport system permease subunit
MVYRPLTEPTLRPVLVVRTDVDPGSTAQQVRRLVPQLAPDVAVVEATTGETAAGVSGALSRLLAAMSAVLGIAALAMSMVGLFGVLSQRVIARHRELGVRTALGATGRGLVRLVLLDGLRPVGEGLLIGIYTAVLLRLAAEPFFPRAVPTMNWTLLLVVPALLLLAAAAACYLPARRAAIVDPAVTLRRL